MLERSRQGAVEILSGRDPWNFENTQDCSSVVDDALRQGQPRLVLDMGQVPFIDSAGLEWLLDLQDRCRRRGGAVKIAAPNPLCRDILRITGVDSQFDIFDEPVRAVGSFAQ